MAISAKIHDIEFFVGDTVIITHKFFEGEKERSQVFQGVVIGIKGRDESKMFTVRKMATGGIGVEKIFPLSSPNLIKIEVKKKGKVRRAKLYYLRKNVK